MMGTLTSGQSAMDELTAAAMGTRLRRKTANVHVKTHKQMNDTGASKYRKNKIMQTGPLMKMGGIAGMGAIKNKLDKTRTVAMDKLESGRTVDYDPDSLERMNPEMLKRMCIKYRLDTTGKPDDLRSRLAELLLTERKRTNSWLKTKNMNVATEINERADEAIGEYEIEMADGINQQELIGITHRSRDGLQVLEKINAGRLEEIGFLDEWHKDYQPIYVDETLFETAAAASSKQGMAWDTILRGKIMAREEIVRLFNQLLADLGRKRQEVVAIRAIVIRAEEEEAQLRIKFETVQRKVNDSEKRLEGLVDEQKAAQAAAKAVAEDAKAARAAAGQAKADLDECMVECDRIEAELLAKIAALEKQHAAEVEEARLRFAQLQQELEVRMADEIESLKKQIAEEEARAKKEYEMKFNEILETLKREGKIEVDRLNKLIEEALARIAALEAQLAELDDELEKLLAQVAAAEAAADAAEEARNAAMEQMGDPDIALFREHYDQFNHWKNEERSLKFIPMEVQTDPEPTPEIPKTESWFKPTPRKNKPRPKLEPLGPPPQQETHMLPVLQQISLEHIVRPDTPPPEPEPEPEPEPPPAPAPAPPPKPKKARSPSPPAPAPAPAPKPKPALKPKAAVKVPTVQPEPEPEREPEPEKKVKKTVAIGTKPKPKPRPPSPEKPKRKAERPAPAPAPPKPKVKKEVAPPEPEPEPERPKFVAPMGIVTPQEEKKHQSERKQQIIEEKQQYAEKQKQKQKQERKQVQPPPPQFIAAKPSANQEAMEAHLPPHLAELVKKQNGGGEGVEYKANTKRSNTGKTQLQRELDTKKEQAAQQERTHSENMKGFQDATSKPGQAQARYAKLTKPGDGVGPGVLDGEHAETPNLLDGEEGARLAAAGRHDPATLHAMKSNGVSERVHTPGRDLQEGIGGRHAEEVMEDHRAFESHGVAAKHGPQMDTTQRPR